MHKKSPDQANILQYVISLYAYSGLIGAKKKSSPLKLLKFYI